MHFHMKNVYVKKKEPRCVHFHFLILCSSSSIVLAQDCRAGVLSSIRLDSLNLSLMKLLTVGLDQIYIYSLFILG